MAENRKLSQKVIYRFGSDHNYYNFMLGYSIHLDKKNDFPKGQKRKSVLKINFQIFFSLKNSLTYMVNIVIIQNMTLN